MSKYGGIGMTPSYEKMLELVGILDAKFAALSATVDKENKDKNRLASRISETQKYISMETLNKRPIIKHTSNLKEICIEKQTTALK